MSWLQVGMRKVNTSLLRYVEREGDTLRLYFQGDGQMLELQGDECRNVWRCIRAEDTVPGRAKGSSIVLQKRVATSMPVAGDAAAKPASADASTPKVSASTSPSTSGHSSSHSHHQHSHHNTSHHGHSQHRHSPLPMVPTKAPAAPAH